MLAMADWARVRWTEASQVGEMLAWRGDLDGDARAAPSAYFAWLRDQGRFDDAAFFLGQALPRFETVAWAAGVVRNLSQEPDRDEALTATLAWLGEPTEANRRAAHAAAERAKDAAPARLAALAAFFSGGSMSPEGQPPVPAPRDAAGRFAAGAVLLAAIQSGDQAASLQRALDTGDVIASRGAEALA